MKDKKEKDIAEKNKDDKAKNLPDESADNEISDGDDEIGKSLRLAVKYFGITNDKVSNKLVSSPDGTVKNNPAADKIEWFLNQSHDSDTKVPVYIAISYSDDAGNAGLRRLTAFDKAVYDAVSTCYCYWRMSHPNEPMFITHREIYRIMNGEAVNNYSVNPNQNQLKKIDESMDKLQCIRMKMDITSEIEHKYIKSLGGNIKSATIKAPLLDSIIYTAETDNGLKFTGYQIRTEPILYSYNKTKGHVLLIPLDILNTRVALRNDEYVTELKYYLVQQIELMRMGKRNSKRILMDSIYSSTHIPMPEERLDDENSYSSRNNYLTSLRMLRKKDRRKVEALLEAWKEKKWIKSYSPVKKSSGRISGYDIDVYPEDDKELLGKNREEDI